MAFIGAVSVELCIKQEGTHAPARQMEDFSQSQRDWLNEWNLQCDRYQHEHITTMYITEFKYTLGNRNLLEGTDYSVRAMEAKYNALLKVCFDHSMLMRQF